MTVDNPESTSSDKTALSPTDWDAISELARAVIGRLRLDEGDTLGRWMAFRVAQLVQEAEAEPEARPQATELVLRLWRHRTDWPSGWLPPNAQSQLEWLLGDSRPEPTELSDTVDATMKAVTRSLQQEYSLWLRAAQLSPLETDTDDPLLRWETPDGLALLDRIRHIQSEDLDLEEGQNVEPESPVDQRTRRLAAIHAYRQDLLAKLHELAPEVQ